MKKNKFISLLKAPEEIGEKEIEGLENLSVEFPYSQAIHVMLAKGAINCAHSDSEKKLNHAAVYTADRKNLKQIIENKKSHQSFPIEGNPDEHQAKTLGLTNHEILKGEITDYIEKLRTEKLNLQFQSNEGVSEDTIEERNNFINDLDLKIIEAETKLAKLDFSESALNKEGKILENDENEPTENEESENPLTEEGSETENPVYSELEENLKALKSYKESNEKDSEEGTKTPSETITTLSNNVERERMEEYLASLKATEPENISNEKLKEQIKIINKFIENEPKLSRLEREEGSQKDRIDLSLRSLKVHQNIASENLALIMVKQGKLEKAEEIYNKLIWKFPEKKAYFVARIEELKKK